jgi:uncharacterized NAD(P)/FAD-binding protein YdhS
MGEALGAADDQRDPAASLPLFEDSRQAATQPAGKRPIAVVGAGFSGTIAALQLLRGLPEDQPVLLCERAPEFARGVAYATGDLDHLLNVRAANMSALADQPNHFADWLKRHARAGAAGVHETAAGQFASRGLYGQYLRGLLDIALRESAHHARLRLMPDDVTDITRASKGSFWLTFASGTRLEVAGVVLAVGNLAPEESLDPRICADPWGKKAWAKLEGDLPVLIVGTGLTMVDLAVSIRRGGFGGRIIAMSRGGLMPQRHEAGGTWPTPVFTEAETRSIRLMTARVRQELRAAAAENVDWRAVIDSLRPVTAKLWAGMPVGERHRFLRHARRYWDVHRHRMAPPHAEMIGKMRDEGSLEPLAGRIRRIESTYDGALVSYRARGATEDSVLKVQRVIMANGLEQIDRTRDPLMQRLLAHGLVRVDRQGLGLEVTDQLNVVGADGAPAERIWALGPIVRGVFWECIAVPDIRGQARDVAAHVGARLRADAPRWSFTI